jgi:dimethylamine/trimethylamine dehydrogenase
MARNPRYDTLFEPVKIGPVTAKNRFYQVPHASSTGNDMPNTRAGLRAIRAEGGWAVVCTGYCSIHPTADDSPHRYSRLWDEEDVKNLAQMTDAVHEHGALAGVELFHGSTITRNRYSREMPLSPTGLPYLSPIGSRQYPLHSRAMDKSDIKDLRRWQVTAAKRAKRAGFDIVYIYCGMGFGPYQFLSRRSNQRSDEYGGPIENRVRLLRELIEETKEAIGADCAVAVRISTDELMGPLGLQWHDEGQAVFKLLGELPDLWDLKTFGFQDSSNARYSEEGYQEPYVAFAKQVTSKPVVGVGRFTSPDAMVSQVRRGVLDLIGAARPSIADPFLPKKLDEGREDDIRECIGCNICYSSYHEGVPIRCTQNPTMGEEWRRGWHPEKIASKSSEDAVLVVGAGPAGLEAARALGQRGYQVTLAEADLETGGRLLKEAHLPGLATWMRVRDWRLGQIQKMVNVDLYLDSRLEVQDILEFGFSRVILATGASWIGALTDCRGVPLPHSTVLTPADVFAGAELLDPVLIYDYEHYVMGSCLAEMLAEKGHRVIFVTPGDEVGGWSRWTHDQWYGQKRLIELGVDIRTARYVTDFDSGAATTLCTYSGRPAALEVGSLIVVGARRPKDALYQSLAEDPDALAAAGIRSLQRIGDCEVPGAVVHAVYVGHKLAREFDEQPNRDAPFKLERAVVGI